MRSRERESSPFGTFEVLKDREGMREGRTVSFTFSCFCLSLRASRLVERDRDPLILIHGTPKQGEDFERESSGRRRKMELADEREGGLPKAEGRRFVVFEVRPAAETTRLKFSSRVVEGALTSRGRTDLR